MKNTTFDESFDVFVIKGFTVAYFSNQLKQSIQNFDKL